MMDRSRKLEIIQGHPLGNHLDAFRTKHKDQSVLNTLNDEDLKGVAYDVLMAMLSHKISRQLPSNGRGKNLFDDISRAINSDNLDLDRIKPLFNAVLSAKPDAEIWHQVYDAVTESTPPPRSIASSLYQTPWHRNTGSFVNTSEHRKHVDDVLREELGVIYVDVPQFHEIFFGGVAELQTASEAYLKKCTKKTKKTKPLFGKSWIGWPEPANENAVSNWLEGFTKKLAVFAAEYKPGLTCQRRLMTQPNKTMRVSNAGRKLGLGFVNDLDAGDHWSQILVPGELKSNPSADIASQAWFDISKYAREVLAAQDARRFVLGFTLCGSLMRVWEFDRLGAIASEQFDINKDALRFVSTILGFLWISKEDLGFDPTIKEADAQRYIEIERAGRTERLIIDGLMTRATCIAGRATTCWKAHLQGYQQMPLVIKDSWQYTERDEEGEMLQEATVNGVTNVARYYHHETVQVCDTNDDICGNVRKSIDVTNTTRYPQEHPKFSSSKKSTDDASSNGLNSSKARRKRTSSEIDSPLPDSKRASIKSDDPLRPRTRASTRTDSPLPPMTPASTQTDSPVPPKKRSRSMPPPRTPASYQTNSPLPSKKRSRSMRITEALPNRIHRRVILCDYGKPIYRASSRPVLLSALEGCITGHQSLHKAGFLHRDISINNLMLNEDEEKKTSWPSFLIDLDLAIKVSRDGASGARGKTSTRAFMAIGALQGEQHCFMHDLESFFWVLFWICIHYDGPDKKSRVVERFEKWNFMDTEDLAINKIGMIADEGTFHWIAAGNFTPYYQPLIRLITDLRSKVFPNGERWKKASPELYNSMKEILREAQKDPEVVNM